MSFALSFGMPSSASGMLCNLFQALKQEREKALLKITDEKFKCKLCGKLLVVMSQCQLAELDKHSVV